MSGCYVIRFDTGGTFKYNQWTAACEHIMNSIMPYDPEDDEDVCMFAKEVLKDVDRDIESTRLCMYEDLDEMTQELDGLKIVVNNGQNVNISGWNIQMEPF